jgi:hypothetical protein
LQVQRACRNRQSIFDPRSDFDKEIHGDQPNDKGGNDNGAPNQKILAFVRKVGYAAVDDCTNRFRIDTEEDQEDDGSDEHDQQNSDWFHKQTSMSAG